jgi:hypothetical protein
LFDDIVCGPDGDILEDIADKWGSDAARTIARHFIAVGEAKFRKRKGEELRALGAPDWILKHIERLP